jgi:tRNA(Arg) A34 adenosine deaminase TadA
LASGSYPGIHAGPPWLNQTGKKQLRWPVVATPRRRKIVAEAANTGRATNDPSAHAELNVLRMYSIEKRNFIAASIATGPLTAPVDNPKTRMPVVGGVLHEETDRLFDKCQSG